MSMITVIGLLPKHETRLRQQGYDVKVLDVDNIRKVQNATGRIIVMTDYCSHKVSKIAKAEYCRGGVSALRRLLCTS